MVESPTQLQGDLGGLSHIAVYAKQLQRETFQIRKVKDIESAFAKVVRIGVTVCQFDAGVNVWCDARQAFAPLRDGEGRAALLQFLSEQSIAQLVK